MTVWRDEEAPGHDGELIGLDESGSPYLYRKGRTGYRPWKFVDFLDRPGGTWSGSARGVAPPEGPPAGLRVLCTCGWESAIVPYRPQNPAEPGQTRSSEFWAVDSLRANDLWQAHLCARADTELGEATLVDDYLARIADELRTQAPATPRAVLRTVRDLRALADTAELAALAAARAHQTPWRTLAADLGISEGTVTSRYTRPPRALSATYGHTDALRSLLGDPDADPDVWPAPTPGTKPDAAEPPAPERSPGSQA